MSSLLTIVLLLAFPTLATSRSHPNYLRKTRAEPQLGTASSTAFPSTSSTVDSFAVGSTQNATLSTHSSNDGARTNAAPRHKDYEEDIIADGRLRIHAHDWCTDDSQCPENMECIDESNGECSNPPCGLCTEVVVDIDIGNSVTDDMSMLANLDWCTDDSQCPQGQVCVDRSNGICWFPPCGQCEAVPNIGDTTAMPDSCTDNAQCPQGQACIDRSNG